MSRGAVMPFSRSFQRRRKSCKMAFSGNRYFVILFGVHRNFTFRYSSGHCQIIIVPSGKTTLRGAIASSSTMRPSQSLLFIVKRDDYLLWFAFLVNHALNSCILTHNSFVKLIEFFSRHRSSNRLKSTSASLLASSSSNTASQTWHQKPLPRNRSRASVPSA
jgi:hypothetical protein